MKLIATVCAICLVLVVACAYMLIVGLHGDGPSAAASSPVPVGLPASAPVVAPGPPADRVSVGVADKAAATAGKERPEPNASAVRWADESARRIRQRELERTARVLLSPDASDEELGGELKRLGAGGRWADALIAVERLLERAPGDTRLKFERAAILMRLERFVPAIDALTQVVRAEPGHGRAWFNLAVAHQALGHLREAQTAWDKAIELAPTTPAHAQRGALRLDAREWAQAAEDFEAVLAREPDAPDAVMNLALAQEQLSKFDEAIAVLRAFVERWPNNLVAVNRLADLAHKAGLRVEGARRQEFQAQAAQWCERSLAIDPNQPMVRDVLEDVRAGR